MTKKEREKARYEKAKAEHRCVECGIKDERTLAGKLRCEACARNQCMRNRKRPTIKKNDGLEIKPKRKSTLAQHIQEASVRGMSYGKYMAMIGDARNER